MKHGERSMEKELRGTVRLLNIQALVFSLYSLSKKTISKKQEARNKRQTILNNQFPIINLGFNNVVWVLGFGPSADGWNVFGTCILEFVSSTGGSHGFI